MYSKKNKQNNQYVALEKTIEEKKLFNPDKVWYHESEKTGKPAYFRDSGEIIPDFSYAKYGSCTLVNEKDQFPTFEAFMRFRLEVISFTLDLIDRVKQGETWEPYSGSASAIVFRIEYPNGKNGDVDMYLSEMFGSIRMIGPTTYEVVMSSEYKDELALVANYSPALLAEGKKPLYSFLNEYNLYLKLRSLHDDSTYHRAWLASDELLNEALDLADAYFKRIRRSRNEIFSKLLEMGVTTPRWVSEYRLFILVKSIYPDAVFQFRADWLGKQSLDIYIPSISLAIEYQGIQHFEAISFFGGEEKLKERIELDQKKRMLCSENKVKLIEFRYDETLEPDSIVGRIKSMIQ